MGKYRYSKRSELKLDSCHFSLQLLAREMLAMEIVDIVILSGRRGMKEQNALYPKYSNAMWPSSKHNVEPPKKLSDAIDMAPIVNGKIPWQKDDEGYEFWYILGGMAMAIAKKHSLNIKWAYYLKYILDLPHYAVYY